MELLPQLRLEPKNMILPRRLTLEKSPNDGRFSFPVGQRRRYELLFDVFHTSFFSSSVSELRGQVTRLKSKLLRWSSSRALH